MIGERVITSKTKYGAAIGLIKGEEIFLSRRVDTPLYAKKWQFANGRLRGEEDSKEAACRIVEEQTGIFTTPDRLHYLHLTQLTDIDECYYTFLLNLRPTECPVLQELYKKFFSDWRAFKLEKAVVLDLVPGIRVPIRKLLVTLLRLKSEATTQQRILAF